MDLYINEGCARYASIVYVTSPLNPLSRRGDLVASLRMSALRCSIFNVCMDLLIYRFNVHEAPYM